MNLNSPSFLIKGGRFSTYFPNSIRSLDEKFVFTVLDMELLNENPVVTGVVNSKTVEGIRTSGVDMGWEGTFSGLEEYP